MFIKATSVATYEEVDAAADRLRNSIVETLTAWRR